MGLVTAKEVAKAINTEKYGIFGTFTGWLLMKVLKISTLNKIYDRNKHLKDVEFLKVHNLMDYSLIYSIAYKDSQKKNVGMNLWKRIYSNKKPYA